jgi:hypothetical protein
MSPEAKAELLKRLQGGRAKTKAMREEAKSKGLPDPKPRKPRAKKMSEAGKQALMDKAHASGVDENAKRMAGELAMKRAGKMAGKHAEPVDAKEALPDPMANKPAREGPNAPRPIDAAKNNAVNQVAAMPPSPEDNKSTEIDVPNLPDKKNPKKMVSDPDTIPEAAPRKGISTTGKPDKYNNNDMIRSLESGDSAISVQYPGQKESIKKMLKVDKAEDKPLAPAPNPTPKEKTVRSVTKHVQDVKAVESRAPFSFAAIRKVLYQ